MKRYIHVTSEQRQKLLTIFGCTSRTINNALSFRHNNDLAKKIQMAARKMGACTYVVAEESECFYDVKGNLVQPFQNGAVLELDKESGKGTIRRYGKLVAMFDDVKVIDIPGLQQQAQNL